MFGSNHHYGHRSFDKNTDHLRSEATKKSDSVIWPKAGRENEELAAINNPFELNDQLEVRLIFGSYPEVVKTVNHGEKEEYLRDISSSLIYKDIFELEMIKYPLKIRDLLKLLAYQAGSQVSIHELGIKLGLNRETVERYLFLLE